MRILSGRIGLFSAIALVGILSGVGATFAYRTFVRPATLEIPGPASTVPPGIFAGDVATPEQLIIPKIGVDARIKPVGVDAHGDLATPGNATDVAWYRLGPRPGAAGVAVIDGHLDTKNVPQAVFYNLDRLVQGDEIEVRASDGRMMIFEVTATGRYAYDIPTVSIFTPRSDSPELNLITCAGDWVPEKHIYNERLVVFARRVE